MTELAVEFGNGEAVKLCLGPGMMLGRLGVTLYKDSFIWVAGCGVCGFGENGDIN